MIDSLETNTLSLEETEALAKATKGGKLSIQLYRQGAFSEPDFILFGVLQRLVIRKRLSYLGWNEDPRNAVYHFAPSAAQFSHAA